MAAPENRQRGVVAVVVVSASLCALPPGPEWRQGRGHPTVSHDHRVTHPLCLWGPSDWENK